VFNFSVLSPTGEARSAGFGDLYKDGVVLAPELRVGVRPFGLPGHQLIGGSWSSKMFSTLEQDRRVALTLIGLPDGMPIGQHSGSWAVYYNFDQFLYTTKADGSRGIGIFGRIGLADSNTNPFEQFYSFGIGGQGMLPGRDRDRFGIGAYYTSFSRDLRGLILDSSEIGLEIFYNIAATKWFYVTPKVWGKPLNDTIELFGANTEAGLAQHHWPKWGQPEILAYLEKQHDLYSVRPRRLPLTPDFAFSGLLALAFIFGLRFVLHSNLLCPILTPHQEPGSEATRPVPRGACGLYIVVSPKFRAYWSHAVLRAAG
jgi:Carbohydrate-selective porin, OprB family